LQGIALVAAFVCVVGLLSYRTSTKLDTGLYATGRPNAAQWGLADFRDNLYYPVVSFLEGQNPYDRDTYMRSYPVVNGFPLYLPLTILVYLPFGLLPLDVAQVIHYALTLGLTLVLAAVTLRLCGLEQRMTPVFGLATLMLLSRPGHWNLVLGNCAVPAVLGLYVALLYGRERPWLAGLGLALSTFKPTFGLPAAILMLARRETRAVVIGLGVSGVLSTGIAGVIVYQAGGIGEFIHSIQANYTAWQTVPVVSAASNAFRVDVVALVGRFLGRPPTAPEAILLTVAVLAVGALVVRHLTTLGKSAAVRRLSTSVICLSVLTCTYHQAYDMLLLAMPLTALVMGSWPPPVPQSPAVRRLLLLLLGLPAANYLASGTAMGALGITGGTRLAITSFNGMALLIALFVYVAVSLQQSRFSKPGSIRSVSPRVA
jgi:hypothetical protein